ncbi:molybdenum cofactor biosynthesis protein MoaE [Flammeovirga kamogawensis]|uniref:Molybdopterin synthase catalytic subunit n=1 Tax=Flammeovirga kamogawensis TaxID=373891 RepID=A0ABX8GUW8_9BACT|nr:molybdenum cofactor biosynthesis protein MoaE [Flammeovirga kamogawensis]MBB6461686.1 molybdopterin synthase catalytic subunit [Flammeovirga kamogawensis]QWG07389.1 molybdenum cofactor biosynthesis protein MoaE [Flammeovirga kamogawensis]TRX69202.1 molybdenum cofactor biosynthesis protein MoaE [Flammeovirga kamogawensis]
MIELKEQKDINISAIIDSVKSDYCGAVDVFIGTVRDNLVGKKVTKLFFEAYTPMAISELSKIANTVKERYQADKVSIVHAVGDCLVGETAVVIAVSTPHRKASFEGCQYAIDTLKDTVPIWKREYFEDGSHWVFSHP